MTLQQLRYVVALAETQHFARAAERCHVSQSTLSIQLKKLEVYLGVTLFDRSLRRVMPTPLGREIVARAQNLLRETEQMRALARSQRSDPMDHTVRLGVIPTVAPYLLPRVLPVVHHRHPRLRLLLREANTENLLTELHMGRIDAALLSPPVPEAGLHLRLLYHEPFLAALHADSPLAKQKRVSLQALAKERLLLLEEGHCLRNQTLDVCGQSQPHNEEIKATSLEMLRQMVACGIGCTLLPVLAAHSPSAGDKADAHVTLRPFQPPAPGRFIALVWRNRQPLQETLQRLAGTLADHLPKDVTPI